MLQRKYSQKWREANREKYNQLQNQYYHESARSPELLEKMRQYSREYRRKNLDRARTRAREYRDKQRQTRIAAGTNLAIGFVMGSLGWVGHAINGDVDYQLLLLMGSGAAVGSYFGAKLTGKVELTTLVAAMGYVLVPVGVILIWRGVTA